MRACLAEPCSGRDRRTAGVRRRRSCSTGSRAKRASSRRPTSGRGRRRARSESLFDSRLRLARLRAVRAGAGVGAVEAGAVEGHADGAVLLAQLAAADGALGQRCVGELLVHLERRAAVAALVGVGGHGGSDPSSAGRAGGELDGPRRGHDAVDGLVVHVPGAPRRRARSRRLPRRRAGTAPSIRWSCRSSRGPSPAASRPVDGGGGDDDQVDVVDRDRARAARRPARAVPNRPIGLLVVVRRGRPVEQAVGAGDREAARGCRGRTRPVRRTARVPGSSSRRGSRRRSARPARSISARAAR